MSDTWIKLRIGAAYLQSIPTYYIKIFWLKVFCLFVACIPDKWFISLVTDASAHILNVTRKYDVHYEEHRIRAVGPNIYNEVHIENFTYAFRYLFENLSIDRGLSLDELSKFIKFDYLAIDYFSSDIQKLNKKIITPTDHGFQYCNIGLVNVAPVLFDRITLNST